MFSILKNQRNLCRKWVHKIQYLHASNGLISKSPFSSLSTPSKSELNSTALHAELAQKIKLYGPITLHEYMKTCLTHPLYGFYMNQDVFGPSGHFTTSPEISQLFGELIAVWILFEWMKAGQVKPLRIVELGPGRGTLTADLCRVFSQFEQSKDVCTFSLVEVSPYLKFVQQALICRNIEKAGQNLEHYKAEGMFSSKTVHGQRIDWYRSLDMVPEEHGFTVFLANEFFDAFPIHKFVKSDNKWHELLVDVDLSVPLTPAQPNPPFRWIRARHQVPWQKVLKGVSNESSSESMDSIAGDQFEFCPQTLVVIDQIIRRINKNDGFLLVCDYGHDEHMAGKGNVKRDTFRAFRSHEQVDPLIMPGTADLTADVDFNLIRENFASDANIFGTISQKQFLVQLGIEVRFKKLLEVAKNPQHQEDLASGVKMLLDDMGECFKFMAVFGKSRPEKPVAF